MPAMIASPLEEEPDDALDPHVILEAASDIVAWLIDSMPEDLRERAEAWLWECED